MLFNTLQYLVFFWLVVGLYWSVPHRARWPLLVAASCYFYMVLVPVYILILFAVILVDFVAGLWIDASSGRMRKLALWTSLAANIGILAVFKYWGFFREFSIEFGHLLGVRHTPLVALNLILPIGLSFHTFQSMSYTIEVYWKRQRPERHLGIYALYVLFFPQMVAGPIERPQNVLHQLHEAKTFDASRFAEGLRLILWGLFKKSVLADNLAGITDQAWTNPMAKGPWLALSAFAFSYQILCDFSGYSDIARGSARCLGIDLMRNFDRPYMARSIGEFWRRWHISLSSWFRDYVYIPLGGSRVAPWRRGFNYLVVFTFSGFWHGADWAFVLWGFLHGVALVWENLWGRPETTRAGIFAQFRTFGLVTLAWILFRAGTFSEATSWFSRLTSDGNWMPSVSAWQLLLPCGLAFVAWIESRRERDLGQRWDSLGIFGKASALGAFLSIILIFGRFDARNFIYFQF